MVATLSHTPPRVVDNFYQNSFKQLSMVQQRQVGLLVGAAVADAAARPLDGFSSAEVEAFIHQKRAEAQEVPPPPLQSSTQAASAEDLVVFARVSPRGLEPRDTLEKAPASSELLHTHSFSYQLLFEVLRAMSSARGEFPVAYVQERLVQAARALENERVFVNEHASLLHTLCCLLPMPAIYPYASDATLRRYLDPFVDFLTESPTRNEHTASFASPSTLAARAEAAKENAASEASVSPAEAAAAERAAVRDFTLSTLGVVLRNLQSNPDSTRNAAFMAVPGTQAIFPSDVQPFVPTLMPSHGNDRSGSADTATAAAVAARGRLWEVQQQLLHSTSASAAQAASAGPPRWLPLRATAADAQVVREGLMIARSPVAFATGVAQAIRLGGPTCQRAMLVGALLGAKLGARHIPLDWLSATPDHKPVATMALEVAQWSWNPPHH